MRKRLEDSYVFIKGRPVRCSVFLQDGTRFISLRCCEETCRNKCVISCLIPSAHLSVSVEKLAVKFSSLCDELAKAEKIIDKPNGQLTLISRARGE